MSKFDTLFPVYFDRTSYLAKRGNMIKATENASLYNNSSPSAGNYAYLDAYTIGYGYDISQQNGKTILNEFAAAGISLPPNIVSLLANYNTGDDSTTLSTLNTAFMNGGAGGSRFSLTETQATNLLNAVLPRYEVIAKNIVVAKTSYANGFTLANNGLHALVVSEVYNAGDAIFGTGQNNAIKTDSTNDFLFDVLFKNNKDNGNYVAGLENRRIIDLSAALGVSAGPYDSSNRITNINFNGNMIAALDVYRALRAHGGEISTIISGYTPGSNGYTQLSALNSSLLSDTKALFGAAGTGFYVVLSGETKAAVAAKFATDTALLDRLNGGAGFTDGSFAVGDVVRVPINAVTVGAGPIIIGAASRYQVLAYDATNSKIYTTGTTIDRNGYGQIVDDSTGQAMTLLTTDGVISATQPISGTIKISGANTIVSLPNFTATLDGTKINLAGKLTIQPTSDTANQVRTEIKALSLVNDAKLAVGTGSFLKISGAISSSFTPLPTGVAVASQADGSTYNVGGNNLIGSGQTANSWTGAAKVTGGGWSARYGTMASILNVDDPSRYTITNPILRGFGEPFYSEGIVITATTSPDLYTPIKYSTESITYNFSTPLPIGTRFYLVDPGASETVIDQATSQYVTANSFNFNFTAAVKTNGVSAPVNGAFALTAYDPYGYNNGSGQRVYDRPSGSGSYTLNSAAGTVNATNNPNTYENAPPYRPDTIIVATTTTEIDSITVTGQTILYDKWGLFFDVGSPELKLGANATLELGNAVDRSQNVIFDTNGQETLILDDAPHFDGVISNFGFGDRIIFKMQQANDDIRYSYNFASLTNGENKFKNTLTIVNHTTGQSAQINFARNEDLSRVNLGTDSSDPSAVAVFFDGYVYNGTSGNDSITGSSGGDSINGLGGTDLINAGGGNDKILIGGQVPSGTTFTGSIVNAGDGDDNVTLNGSYVGAGAIGGVTIDGGIGRNTLISISANLSLSSISNFQILNIEAYRQVTLSAAQLAMFDSVNVYYNSQDPLQYYMTAASAGVYDMRGKNFTTAGALQFIGSAGNDTVFGNSTGSSSLWTSSISAGAGNDTIYATTNSAMITKGEDGDDTFIVDLSVLSTHTVSWAISGGAGINTIKTIDADVAKGGLRISDITNVQVLDVVSGAVYLTSSQLNGFSTLIAETGRATIQADIWEYSTYDISTKNITGIFDLSAVGSYFGAYLAGNGSGQTLTGSDFNDVLQGLGGADQMFGGLGDDEFLIGGSEIVAGEIVDGGAGNNKISAWGGNLSLASISNVQTLNINTNAITVAATQFAGFSNINNNSGAATNVTAATAGTYSLNGKSVSGILNITGSAGNDYLAGNAASQTLSGGDGNDQIQGMGGVDTLLGGNGNDEFLIGGNEAAAGSVVDGGAGVNRISSWNVDLSGVTVSNVQVLGLNLATAKLTAAQFSGLTTIENNSGTTATITGATAGTYSLNGKAVTGAINIIGTAGNDYLAGNGANQTLSGGDGNDQIQGIGGVDTLLGGIGDDEFLIGGTEAAAGSVVDGGAGVNKISSWNVDLTGVAVSNIQSLSLNLPLATLTAVQFSGLTTIVNNSGTTGTVTAASAGTYSFAGKTITGAINLTGSSGNDTLIGNAAAQTIAGAAGNDTLDGAGGTDVLQGGIGNDTYKFGLGYGSDTITDNDSTAGNTDILSFASGTARDQIWFSQSGSDLLVRIIGTTDQMTISGWYNGSANHVEQLKTSANNVLLDSQVQNLVNAMAGMAFPTTTTLTAQQHAQLDSVIAANWT